MSRQTEYRQRMKDKGLTQVNVWINDEHKSALQAYAKALCGGEQQSPPIMDEYNASALIEKLDAEFIDAKDAALSKMSKTAGKQTMRVIASLTDLLLDLTRESTRKHVQANLGPAIEKEKGRIHELSRETTEKLKIIKIRNRKVNGILSKSEYRQVLGCLHPDRGAPAGQETKYSKAFEIFKRLSQSVAWDR